MKSMWIIFIFGLAFFIVMAGSAPSAPSRIQDYEGKVFAGPQDPDYKEYDLALRNHLVKRIHKRFGLELDPQTYSGFDLLEIEALIKLKKSSEPPDLFLKIFPRTHR
jgi:hypothetical protein